LSGWEKMKNEKILVLVPAYNEAENIRGVILDVQKNLGRVDILVVNDGSTDNTLTQVRKTKAIVLNLSQNLGIGGSVQAGLLYAVENDYDLVLRLDGDGQHRAEDLRKLKEKLQKSKLDVLIGSRFRSHHNFKFGFFRKIGIRYFSWLVSALTHHQILDPTSGLQAINRPALQFLAKNYPQDYPEVEAVLILSLAGFKIGEMAAKMKERSGGTSSISWRKSIYYMLKVTLAILVNLIRNKPKRS